MSITHYEVSHTTIAAEARPHLKKPSLYQVVLLNDDFTPMNFVIEVLEQFFGLNRDKATQIMLQVHTQGKGLCGIFSYDVAETKIALVADFAKQHEHPLLCDMETLQ